jgi:N-acetylmuramoyl-L-alanine amidase
VIDAGHGGHDSGTIGVDGLEEKDVVLDVALRLGKLLHDRLGSEIIYTRSDDTFIPLETRTAIANKSQADLFLSIHANSSRDSTARGVETYYLNFTSQGNSGLKNRGVKKAPFVVLIGANMPSILAEISFVTNPRDADQLRQPEYRQRVAESLFQGVSKYEAGLSGSRTRVEQAQAVTRGTPPPAQ